MNLSEAQLLIRNKVQRMNALYGRTLFDEWALLGMSPQGAKILAYAGPRERTFASTLAQDAVLLRAQLRQREIHVGDFEFVDQAEGASLDALIRVGPAAYFVANHTSRTMAELRQDPNWRDAQAAWLELAQAFQADPLE